MHQGHEDFSRIGELIIKEVEAKDFFSRTAIFTQTLVAPPVRRKLRSPISKKGTSLQLNESSASFMVRWDEKHAYK